MKNYRLLFSACALAFTLGTMAQTQYDAARLMDSELNGTARFVGMGGAMGALGGDLSVISSNPAGIGIYRSNDFSTSFGFNHTKTESDFAGTKMKDHRNRASFDQIGFVYSMKVGNQTSLRYVNFGFNYHKSRNFNKLFAAGGDLGGLSQTWQMANMFGQADYIDRNNNHRFDIDVDPISKEVIDRVYNSKNPYTAREFEHYPYLSMLGVRTDLVGVDADNKLIGWHSDNHKYTSREEGGINQYDFNVSFNIQDRVYLGVTLGAYDVNYKRTSYYTEDIFYPAGNHQDDEGFYELTNWFETKGTGVDVKLGVIARPFEDSPFRIGLAVHTPTWYELTDYHTADLYSKYTLAGSTQALESEEYLPNYVGGDMTRDYKLITPWKFNLSMGTTFENVLAVGAEYEFMDASTAELQYENGDTMEGQTAAVEEDLKKVHTLRLGMEARLTPQFSLRAGYNYRTALFKDSAFKLLNMNDTRTDTEYDNTKELNTFTVGMGYRGRSLYADLAYKCDTYKSDFFAFDEVGLQATKVDHTRHQVLMTVGIRF